MVVGMGIGMGLRLGLRMAKGKGIHHQYK